MKGSISLVKMRKVKKKYIGVGVLDRGPTTRDKGLSPFIFFINFLVKKFSPISFLARILV